MDLHNPMITLLISLSLFISSIGMIIINILMMFTFFNHQKLKHRIDFHLNLDNKSKNILRHLHIKEENDGNEEDDEENKEEDEDEDEEENKNEDEDEDEEGDNSVLDSVIKQRNVVSDEEVYKMQESISANSKMENFTADAKNIGLTLIEQLKKINSPIMGDEHNNLSEVINDAPKWLNQFLHGGIDGKMLDKLQKVANEISNQINPNDSKVVLSALDNFCSSSEKEGQS